MTYVISRMGLLKVPSATLAIDIGGAVGIDGDVTVTQTSTLIKTDSADASDTKSITITAASAAAASRGAYLVLRGNEVGSGTFSLVAGAGGAIELKYGASETVGLNLSTAGVLTLGSSGFGGTHAINGSLTVTGAFTPGSVSINADTLVLNADAAGSGADWTATLTRPTSGMSAASVLTLPTATSTLSTLALAETLTNKTLTSPAINTATIAGGTIDSATIGATTASTGAFTTLASSGVSTLNSLVVTGSTTVGTTLGVTGATTLAGMSATSGSFSTTLGVTGASTFTGAITANGGIIMGASTTVDSAAAGTLNLGTANASSINLGTASGTQTVNIGTGSGTTTINLGGSADTVNIAGTLTYVNTTNLQVTDKLITVNKGGGASTGFSTGIEVEEDALITGYAKTSSTGASWDLKAPTTGIIRLTPGGSSSTTEIISLAVGSIVWTIPNGTDTFVGTTATQTVTNKTFQASNGSAATPSFGFVSSTATGLYRKAAQSLGFAANGVEIGYYDINGAWVFGLAGGTQSHSFNGDKLTIVGAAGTSTPRIQFSSPTSGPYISYTGSGGAIIPGSAEGDLCFVANSKKFVFSGDNATTNHGQMTAAGAWTFGADVGIGRTDSGPSHILNGTLKAGGTGTGDEQMLLFTANARTGVNTPTRVAGTGGSALYMRARASDSSSAFRFVTNLAADGTTTEAGDVLAGTQAGAWTIGPTSSSPTTNHVLNGTLNAGGSSAGDQGKALWLGANAYNATYASAARTAGVSGAAILMLARSAVANDTTAFQFYTNLQADTTTTASALIGTATSAGAWTLGASSGSAAITHVIQTNVTSESQLNVRSSSTDNGIYLTSFNGSNGVISSGMKRTGSAWQGRSTGYGAIEWNTNGSWIFYQGATSVGAAIATPTSVGAIADGGAWTLGPAAGLGTTASHIFYGRTVSGAQPVSYQGGIKFQAYAIQIGCNAGDGAPALTDSTTKAGFILAPHWDNDALPFALMSGVSNNSLNEIIIGGGASVFNASTAIRFYTGATVTTTAGIDRGGVNSSGNWTWGASTGTYTDYHTTYKSIVGGNQNASSMNIGGAETVALGANFYRGSASNNAIQTANGWSVLQIHRASATSSTTMEVIADIAAQTAGASISGGTTILSGTAGGKWTLGATSGTERHILNGSLSIRSNASADGISYSGYSGAVSASSFYDFVVAPSNFTGVVTVSSYRNADGARITSRTYFVSHLAANTSTYTQLGVDHNGTVGGNGFTIARQANGTIRVTDTSGVIAFFNLTLTGHVAPA